MLWSLAKLRLQPPLELLQVLVMQSSLQLSGRSNLGRPVPEEADSGLDATSLTNLVWALGKLHAQLDKHWLREFEQTSLQVLASAGIPELVNMAWGLHRLGAGPASLHWQAACLKQLQVRCLSCGQQLECRQLAELLDELGVPGLLGGAALADASCAGEVEGGVEFQPGCR